MNSTNCYSTFTYPEDSAFYPPLAQAPHSPHELYIGTVKLYRTTNQGGQWNPVSPNLGGGGTFPDIGTGNVITAIAVANTDSNRVYVGLYDGTLWVSDAGTGPCVNSSCWHQINSSAMPAAPVSRIAIHPADAGTVYAAFSGFNPGSHLFKTTSFGASWNPVDASLPGDRPVNTITIDLTGDFCTSRIETGIQKGTGKCQRKRSRPSKSWVSSVRSKCW